MFSLRWVSFHREFSPLCAVIWELLFRRRDRLDEFSLSSSCCGSPKTLGSLAGEKSSPVAALEPAKPHFKAASIASNRPPSLIVSHFLMQESFSLNSLPLRLRLEPLTVLSVKRERQPRKKARKKHKFSRKRRNNLGESSWALVINNLTESIEKSYSHSAFSYAKKKETFCNSQLSWPKHSKYRNEYRDSANSLVVRSASRKENNRRILRARPRRGLRYTENFFPNLFGSFD